ncbi:MAG: hypothetical protein A2Y73_07510 [Chloroflexi bacterium RBG_13_56_8]|nr:MAG: hypothetical protein A2Y73_07510 [Chloroflexi bacterium RBG_13_56_8]
MRRTYAKMTESAPPNNKRSASVLLVVLAIIAAVGAFRWLENRNTPTAAVLTLTVIKGQAQVTRADAGEGSTLVAGDFTTLQRGDQVITGEGSLARLAFEEGETTDLGSATRVTLLELQRIAWSRAIELEMALHKGSTVTRIQHQLIAGSRFQIETDVATVQAHGTVFQCDALASDHIYVAVSEGAVTVLMGEQSLELQAGQEVYARLGQPLLPEELSHPLPEAETPAASLNLNVPPTLTDLEKTLFPPVLTPTLPGDEVIIQEADLQDASLYTVQKGDTLYSIARAFGVSWQDIWEANRDVLASPELIRVGQQLRIPAPAQ